MNIDFGNDVERTVATLLQIGDRVVEVSRDQVMTRIWDRPGSPLSAMRQHYEGKKTETINYPKLYLESIIYNLVSNAIKYRSKTIQPVIEISTFILGERVQLSVKDNGLGIDLARYGDKLFKLNQIFHEGYDSKGVGLFITKAQIESLGGTISVQSMPNEGCNFTVTF